MLPAWQPGPEAAATLLRIASSLPSLPALPHQLVGARTGRPGEQPVQPEQLRPPSRDPQQPVDRLQHRQMITRRRCLPQHTLRTPLKRIEPRRLKHELEHAVLRQLDTLPRQRPRRIHDRVMRRRQPQLVSDRLVAQTGLTELHDTSATLVHSPPLPDRRHPARMPRPGDKSRQRNPPDQPEPAKRNTQSHQRK